MNSFEPPFLPNELNIFLNDVSCHHQLFITVAVAEADSIMYYTEADTDWWTYNNNTFVPVFADDVDNWAWSSDEFKQTAYSTCGDNTECLYDVFITGDLEIGATSKATGEENEQQNAIIGKFYVTLCVFKHTLLYSKV